MDGVFCYLLRQKRQKPWGCDSSRERSEERWLVLLNRVLSLRHFFSLFFFFLSFFPFLPQPHGTAYEKISLKFWLKISRHRMHPRYFPGNSTSWETWHFNFNPLLTLKYINSLIAKLSLNTWVAFYSHKTKTTAKKEEEKIELVWPISKVLGW